MFEIFYLQSVIDRDIKRLPTPWKSIIQRTIDRKLTTRPDFYGRPLRQGLRGFRKLRIGDYRVIFSMDKRRIVIVAIRHRSKVYAEVEKMIDGM